MRFVGKGVVKPFETSTLSPTTRSMGPRGSCSSAARRPYARSPLPAARRATGSRPGEKWTWKCGVWSDRQRRFGATWALALAERKKREARTVQSAGVWCGVRGIRAVLQEESGDENDGGLGA